MGFFSGALKTLTGGSDSSSSQQSTSGFSLLPQAIQNAYTGTANQYSGVLNNNPASLFTPAAGTPGAAALANIYQGFAPTADSISSDIAAQTNPFDSSVIDTINQQANGNYSALKQQLDSAGQSGSNRALLGANDIDLTRLNQIGSFKQGEYNTALQNALTTLPTERSADANQILNTQLNQQQAPIDALAALSKILGILPSNGGSQSTDTSSTDTSSGIGTISAKGAGSVLSALGKFF